MRHTVFSRLHPLSLAVFLAAALLPAMGSRALWNGAAALAVVILSGLTQDGGRWLRRSAPFLLLMGLTMTVLTPLFLREGETVLFIFIDKPVTLEAILTGVGLGLSVMTVMALFGLVGGVLGPESLLYLLARVIPQSALVLMLATRFLPELGRRLREILPLRRFVGRRRSPAALLRDGMEAVRTLLAWSLEDAVVTAQSMRARGYGLVRRRGVWHPYHFRVWDGIFTMTAVVLAAAAMAGLRGISGAAWLALPALPLLMEGWDTLRWRLYSLKT